MTEEYKNHCIAIGRFYITAGNFIESYQIGGAQRLQKIIGISLLWQTRSEWWWANSTICSMTVAELDNLTDAVQTALNKKNKHA